MDLYDSDTQYYYTGSRYHINWGWGGPNTGYYASWEDFTPSNYSNGRILYLINNIHP